MKVSKSPRAGILEGWSLYLLKLVPRILIWTPCLSASYILVRVSTYRNNAKRMVGWVTISHCYSIISHWLRNRPPPKTVETNFQASPSKATADGVGNLWRRDSWELLAANTSSPQGMSTRPGEGHLAGAPTPSTKKCSELVNFLRSIKTQGGSWGNRKCTGEKSETSGTRALPLNYSCMSWPVTSVPSLKIRDEHHSPVVVNELREHGKMYCTLYSVKEYCIFYAFCWTEKKYIISFWW